MGMTGRVGCGVLGIAQPASRLKLKFLGVVFSGDQQVAIFRNSDRVISVERDPAGGE